MPGTGLSAELGVTCVTPDKLVRERQPHFRDSEFRALGP